LLAARCEVCERWLSSFDNLRFQERKLASRRGYFKADSAAPAQAAALFGLARKAGSAHFARQSRQTVYINE
jgi:hypothetical protein